MPGAEQIETSLFHVTEEDGRLIVRTRTAAYRPILTGLTWLAFAATIVLVGYLFAVRQSQGYWWLAPVPLVLVIFLSARAADFRSAAREQVFAFDRREGRLLRNGVAIETIAHIAHVIVREVVEEGQPPHDFALVVEMDDTRRTLIAEALDLVKGREQIEEVAQRIADYIDVPVVHAQRHPGETWVDR